MPNYVAFPSLPVYDPVTGDPIAELRGQPVYIYQRNTTTQVPLVDMNLLPMAQPLVVNDTLRLPSFQVDGLYEVDAVSGDVRMHIWSNMGSMNAAVAAAASAANSEAASIAASELVDAPADTVASELVKNTSTSTGRAVLDAFRSYLTSAARDSEPLTKWRAAVANAGTQRVQVVAIGDSITQGGSASSMANRWQTILQADLRDGAVGAQYPFLPGYMSNAAWGIGKTGNVTTHTGLGLSWYTAILNDDTSQVTFLFTGDRFELAYSQLTASGIMSVAIDGAAPTLVNTQGASVPTVHWVSPQLADTNHTVVVKRSSTSASGALVYLQGAYTYRGDYASGIRILDAGHSGFASSNMPTGDRGANMAKAVQAAGGADLAIIGFGTNDYQLGVTPAAFKSNIEGVITALRANGFDGSVLLLGMYMAQGRDLTLWQQYLDQLAAIAEADPDVAFTNLRDYMPDIPTPYNDATGLGYYADALHPADPGYARIAEILGMRTTDASVLDMLAERV